MSRRYPDADVLAQRGHWDAATRRVILDRVHNVPPYRFFEEPAQRTLEALCARVIPQDERPIAARVPIAPWIDERCATPDAAGFRYDDLPDEGTAWRLGLEGLDQSAAALHGARFADLDPAGQDAVLEAIRAGDPPGDVWERLPARRWWIHVCLKEIAGVYYAHPTAWDEIGFGGPAYPRGYVALNFGAPEPWEAREAPEPSGAREAPGAGSAADRAGRPVDR